MSKTILCAFTGLVKHAYVFILKIFQIFYLRFNIDDINRVASFLPNYPLPIFNCSTFNDLADLEADNDEPGLLKKKIILVFFRYFSSVANCTITIVETSNKF